MKSLTKFYLKERLCYSIFIYDTTYTQKKKKKFEMHCSFMMYTCRDDFWNLIVLASNFEKYIWKQFEINEAHIETNVAFFSNDATWGMFVFHFVLFCDKLQTSENSAMVIATKLSKLKDIYVTLNTFCLDRTLKYVK